MKLFPYTQFPLLRWTLVALVIGCVLLAFHGVQLALAGEYFSGVLSGVLWLPLAFGLWQRLPAARWAALAVLWVIVVFIPMGTINSFAAMDELGPNPPPVWELLVLRIAPWVVPSLFAIHVLGKYRNEFRWRRAAAA